MKIKKLDEEITYKKITRTHKLEINDKKVRVYEYDNYDSIGNDYEQDYDIDENDKKKLTEEEEELLEYNLYESLRLKVGEELQIEE